MVVQTPSLDQSELQSGSQSPSLAPSLAPSSTPSSGNKLFIVFELLNALWQDPNGVEERIFLAEGKVENTKTILANLLNPKDPPRHSVSAIYGHLKYKSWCAVKDVVKSYSVKEYFWERVGQGVVLQYYQDMRTSMDLDDSPCKAVEAKIAETKQLLNKEDFPLVVAAFRRRFVGYLQRVVKQAQPIVDPHGKPFVLSNEWFEKLNIIRQALLNTIDDFPYNESYQQDIAQFRTVQLITLKLDPQLGPFLNSRTSIDKLSIRQFLLLLDQAKRILHFPTNSQGNAIYPNDPYREKYFKALKSVSKTVGASTISWLFGGFDELQKSLTSDLKVHVSYGHALNEKSEKSFTVNQIDPRVLFVAYINTDTVKTELDRRIEEAFATQLDGIRNYFVGSLLTDVPSSRWPTMSEISQVIRSGLFLGIAMMDAALSAPVIAVEKGGLQITDLNVSRLYHLGLPPVRLTYKLSTMGFVIFSSSVKALSRNKIIQLTPSDIDYSHTMIDIIKGQEVGISAKTVSSVLNELAYHTNYYHHKERGCPFNQDKIVGELIKAKIKFAQNYYWPWVISHWSQGRKVSYVDRPVTSWMGNRISKIDIPDIGLEARFTLPVHNQSLV